MSTIGKYRKGISYKFCAFTLYSCVQFSIQRLHMVLKLFSFPHNSMFPFILMEIEAQKVK